MKNIIKKWWFWVIAIVVCILFYILIVSYIENKKAEKLLSNIGNSASDYISGINNAQSHIDEFSYNYETGKADYKPSKITLEMYDRIKEGMTQEEAVLILGKYDNKLEREDTYILEWGNSYSPGYGGYWIQIVFDTNETVFSKYQVGLK